MTSFIPWSRKSVLSSAVDDWHKRGVIDPEMAQALRADLVTQVTSRSFHSVALLLGVICIAFGVMTFVASNWDGMASLTRVILLFAALWASWFLSVFFKYRKQNVAAQVFVLLACAIFGATIMLFGQIYHIQGDPKDATWLWAMGTIIAAFTTRSVPALALATMVLTVWSFMWDRFDGLYPDYSFLLYWLVCAFGAWWFPSRFVAHLLACSLGIWLFFFSFQQILGADHNLFLFTAAVCGSFVALAIVLVSIDGMNWFKGFEPSMLRYILIFLGGLLIARGSVFDRYEKIYENSGLAADYGIIAVSLVAVFLCAVYAYRQKLENEYDNAVCAIFALVGFTIFFTELMKIPFLVEAYMLAFSIWIIRMGMRLDLRSVSAVGFLEFALLMILFYFKTAGSLLDTSLFYLIFGGLLLASAYFVPRIFRGATHGGKTK